MISPFFAFGAWVGLFIAMALLGFAIVALVVEMLRANVLPVVPLVLVAAGPIGMLALVVGVTVAGGDAGDVWFTRGSSWPSASCGWAGTSGRNGPTTSHPVWVNRSPRPERQPGDSRHPPGRAGRRYIGRIREGIGMSQLWVWIDQDLCTGDGLCTDHCPEVFRLLDDGISYVVDAAGAVHHRPGGAAEPAAVLAPPHRCGRGRRRRLPGRVHLPRGARRRSADPPAPDPAAGRGDGEPGAEDPLGPPGPRRAAAGVAPLVRRPLGPPLRHVTRPSG